MSRGRMKPTDPTPDLGIRVRYQENGCEYWLAEFPKDKGRFGFQPEYARAQVFADIETAKSLAGDVLHGKVVEFVPVGPPS